MNRTLIAAASVLLLAGCASPAQQPEQTVDPTPEDYSSLPTEFPGNGSFVGGEDIQPGTYLVVEEHESCEWFLGVDGKLIASGANDVVVDAGETVEVSGCAVFELAATG